MYLRNLHFIIVSEARNAWVTVVEKPQNKISFQNGKHGKQKDSEKFWNYYLQSQ